jgi:hypothetical protein
MSETKRFPLRVLLTVTTGRLLTEPKGERDNGISDVYDILGWMTNDEPFTHQLPRFADECKPWLLRWFPELAEADVELLDGAMSDHGPSGGIEYWLIKLRVNGCYAEYDVPRIPADDHTAKHPYDELVEMRGTDEGIVVVESPAANSQQDGLT